MSSITKNENNWYLWKLGDANYGYDLIYAEYDSYESSFGFNFNFLGTDLAGGETDYNNVMDKFNVDWQKFARQFVLTVDGIEYSPKHKP